MSDPVIYKSIYSKVCHLVGKPKPSTQQEEDYCQSVEYDTDGWRSVVVKMLEDYIIEIKRPTNWHERLMKLIK
jgi:hypothetical protein